MDKKFDNSGAIFKNTKREKETHPNMTGTATIEGIDYWVSAWTKVGKDGNKFITMAYKRKNQKEDTAPKPNAQFTNDNFDDDKIPF